MYKSITARANANIALIKYWGKRNAVLNLPAAGSLSLTLNALTTTTTVVFDSSSNSDTLTLDGAPAGQKAHERMSRWLDVVRDRAGIGARALVVSHNNFPTASGLASSASAYAALAVAASAAAGLTLSTKELSVLARRGSGSAARSLFGGFVEMLPGAADSDGSDAFAVPLPCSKRDPWEVRMVIAVVGGGVAKKHSSRDAMQHCAETSPLYDGWLHSVPGDVDVAKRAIESRDLDTLGRVAEASAFAMHAAAIASRPAIIYWRPATLACIETVYDLRENGARAYVTIDAGPHVKVLTDAATAADIEASLRKVDGVTDTIISAPGGPARIETDEPHGEHT